jgi:hypothetical protein
MLFNAAAVVLNIKPFSCWLESDWDVLKHIRQSCYKGFFEEFLPQ